MELEAFKEEFIVQGIELEEEEEEEKEESLV
jgi:hypothetical protein